MKGDILYVNHILDCLRRIARYASVGETQFQDDELVQDGILRNLQILTESSQRISSALKSRYPEVDWRGMSGFRNVLVHDYLGVNLYRVWAIISSDLPPLAR